MLLQRGVMVAKKLLVDDNDNSLCQTNDVPRPGCYV